MFGLFICILISHRWEGYSPPWGGIWDNCTADRGHCGWICLCLEKVMNLPFGYGFFLWLKDLSTSPKERKVVWWILFCIFSNSFHFQKTVIRKSHTMLWNRKVLVEKVALAPILQVCMFWEITAASRVTLPKGAGAGNGCRLPRPQPAFPDSPLPCICEQWPAKLCSLDVVGWQ